MTEPDPRAVALAHQMFDWAREGDAEMLARYLDKGVPVDLTEFSGNTLLMLAAYHGHPATVAVLLERGADPDQLNDNAQSPVAGAIFKGEDEVVRLLVGAGADHDLGTPSARATAAMFGRQDLLEHH